jgi:CheY-like chemotaxis protein
MHNPKMESDIREQRAAAKRRIDAAQRGSEPTLGASTKNLDSKIEIRFRDDGESIHRIHRQLAASPRAMNIRSRTMSVLILVVDDEADVEALFRQQFRRELRAERFILDFSASASDALRRIEDVEAELILILSDINMPGMTGLEMLPRIKAMRPDVPVIMITAYADSNTEANALSRGAAGVLTKPVDFDLLRTEIDTRLAALVG